MTLIEALPKDIDGNIILSPAGQLNGENVDGFVSIDWFQTNFSDLADANVPLSDDDFMLLKSIDNYWAQNADKWRRDGLI